MHRTDPYRQFRFRIEIDGIEDLGFVECTFGDTSTEVVKYREENESPISRKLSGLTEYGNITLKWGITDSIDLYKWRQQVIDRGVESAKKNMSIILIDETGNDRARWEIFQAWPIKYKPPDFNSENNEVAIETLEVAHEGFVRLS